MLPAAKKDVLPAKQRSMVIYEYVCHCDNWYVGCTTQRLQERVKQHVPKAKRQKTTATQEQGTHRSQPTRTQPKRKSKAKSKTQYESESDSAIGQRLLESNHYARNYSDSRFQILTTARSQFHLSLLEVVCVFKKNSFVEAKTVRIYPSTVLIRSEPAVVTVWSVTWCWICPGRNVQVFIAPTLLNNFSIKRTCLKFIEIS